MGSFPRDVTDAELAVLQVLWRAGPSSIRAIAEVVYPGDVDGQYSTVKRLLTRMEDAVTQWTQEALLEQEHVQHQRKRRKRNQREGEPRAR